MRFSSNNSPIQDVNSDEIACNEQKNVTGFPSDVVIDIKAGSQVTGLWLHEIGSTGPDENTDNKVIDSGHKGPVMAWLKKVEDATQNPAVGPGDGWFKISEVAYENKQWGVDKLIADEGFQTVTIPECIEDGQYLLRFEVIALHYANVEGMAQFYVSMECAQLNISGGSGAKKPETAQDPGIFVNIYTGENGKPYPDSYIAPGPAVFTC
ncbi:hypothetical protein FQN50_004687 [Emmonsiellopsis sp. PD_5]|nr:hypothetical protein FQN50_004687 [Emmonsiellopsis sp. PD_5]